MPAATADGKGDQVSKLLESSTPQIQSIQGSPPATGASATSQQDVHPYARGSVIEVWHIPKTQDDEDDWWTEDESDIEESEKTVKLCDIIDRVPSKNNNSWKYYVHYRDFNRRMDEWIPASRIVSPPSVGNAKVRAQKKEEMMRRRKQQQQPPPQTTATTEANAPLDRRTRRRKSTNPDVSFADDDMIMEEEVATAPEVAPVEKKPTVLEPLVTTTTVGEHTVATVQAVELDEHEGMDEASLREHEEVTKIKNVGFLELGRHQMETWYFSPLPKEIINGDNDGDPNKNQGFLDVLYVCEFTFRMFARKSELRRFQKRVPVDKRHPPGNEIYRHEDLAMFEVDGMDEKIYCQNLCYIAKLFLDHKTLYFDVDPFLFYVLCEMDDRGYHPVGYFSKEKYSDVGYNLACILSFPANQRKGYGRFLIAFSYELTKKEEKVGSPEKPMSDLGQQAYKPYWASTIIDFLLNQSEESSLSIMDISKRTSIMSDDIVYTLNQLGILKIINGVYFIAAEQNMLTELAKKYPIKEPRIDSSKLHWTPYLTDIRRDKFSIHSKKQSVDAETAPGRVVV